MLLIILLMLMITRLTLCTESLITLENISSFIRNKWISLIPPTPHILEFSDSVFFLLCLIAFKETFLFTCQYTYPSDTT